MELKRFIEFYLTDRIDICEAVGATALLPL
jgi:hypothetical protein